MTLAGVLLLFGADALPSDVQAVVLRRVARFSKFTPENDP
jgi:hypothetical protein